MLLYTRPERRLREGGRETSHDLVAERRQITAASSVIPKCSTWDSSTQTMMVSTFVTRQDKMTWAVSLCLSGRHIGVHQELFFGRRGVVVWCPLRNSLCKWCYRPYEWWDHLPQSAEASQDDLLDPPGVTGALIKCFLLLGGPRWVRKSDTISGSTFQRSLGLDFPLAIRVDRTCKWHMENRIQGRVRRIILTIARKTHLCLALLLRSLIQQKAPECLVHADPISGQGPQDNSDVLPCKPSLFGVSRALSRSARNSRVLDTCRTELRVEFTGGTWVTRKFTSAWYL